MVFYGWRTKIEFVDKLRDLRWTYSFTDWKRKVLKSLSPSPQTTTSHCGGAMLLLSSLLSQPLPRDFFAVPVVAFGNCDIVPSSLYLLATMVIKTFTSRIFLRKKNRTTYFQFFPLRSTRVYLYWGSYSGLFLHVDGLLSQRDRLACESVAGW